MEAGGHTDADCGSQTIEKVCRLYSNGQVQDAIKTLRKHRCSLMDSLHESQGKVDCLDFLVRRMEKKSDDQNSKKKERHK